MNAENKRVEPSSERIPLFGCCGTSTDDKNILNPTLQVSGLAKLVVAGALELRCGVRARGHKILIRKCNYTFPKGTALEPLAIQCSAVAVPSRKTALIQTFCHKH